MASRTGGRSSRDRSPSRGGGGGGDALSRSERDTLAVLTVTELRERLKQYGVRVPSKAVKEELMQTLAKAMRGESLPPFKPRLSAGSGGVEGGGGGREREEVSREERERLASLTVTELKTRIRDRSLPVRRKAVKADLIEALATAMRGEREPLRSPRRQVVPSPSSSPPPPASMEPTLHARLDRLTRDELRQRLVTRGVKLPPLKTLKSNLIDLVIAAEEEETDEETETDEEKEEEKEEEEETKEDIPTSPPRRRTVELNIPSPTSPPTSRPRRPKRERVTPKSPTDLPDVLQDVALGFLDVNDISASIEQEQKHHPFRELQQTLRHKLAATSAPLCTNAFRNLFALHWRDEQHMLEEDLEIAEVVATEAKSETKEEKRRRRRV